MADTPDTPKLESKKVEQVKKFVALAASSNIEEAKNAAYKACQLIRTLRLDIIDPADVNVILQKLALTETKVRQLEAGTRTPFSDDGDDDDFIIRGINQTGRFVRAPKPARDPFGGALFGGRYDPAVGSTPTVDPNDVMTTPVNLKGGARYPGKCENCGKVIATGDAARWQKGVGMWCPEGTTCYHDWKVRQSAQPFSGPLKDLFK